MKAIVLALVVLLASPVVAQQGRVATDYIRVSTEPDFQYRTDMDTVLPVQVRVVRGGVPQPDRVSLELRTEAGELLSIPGGQAWMQDGVLPYPHVVHVNLGRLEAGLYRVVLHASAEGLAREWLTEFDVVEAPISYHAALLGSANREARFVVEATDPNDALSVTVYRDSPTGRVPIEQVTTNKTTLRIPYYPGEAVKIEVSDENGWLNYANRDTDAHGITRYSPWTWYPDFEQTQNYKNQSLREAVTSAAILLAIIAAWGFMRRRTA